MNAQNMPIAPHAEIRHVDAFRRCENFSLESPVRVISTHNPWRRGARAWDLFELVLRKKTTSTIGEIIEDAVAIGYNRYNVMSHLRWLYTWGDFIEIDGQRYFPEVKLVPEPEPVLEPVEEVRPVVIAEKKKSVAKRTKGKSQRTKKKARRRA
jgi:hypothetical protein